MKIALLFFIDETKRDPRSSRRTDVNEDQSLRLRSDCDLFFRRIVVRACCHALLKSDPSGASGARARANECGQRACHARRTLLWASVFLAFLLFLMDSRSTGSLETDGYNYHATISYVICETRDSSGKIGCRDSSSNYIGRSIRFLFILKLDKVTIFFICLFWYQR